MSHGAPLSICAGVSKGTQLLTGGASVLTKLRRAGGYASTPLDAPVPTTQGMARSAPMAMYDPKASFRGVYAMLRREACARNAYVSYEMKFICLHQCTTATMQSSVASGDAGGRAKKNFPDANDLVNEDELTAENLEIVKKTYLRLYTSRLQLLRKCRELRKHNDELQRQLAVKHAMDYPRKEWGVAMSDVEALQVRVRELEEENAQLRGHGDGDYMGAGPAATAPELLLDAATISGMDATQ